jgi:hypothetical protein
MRERDTRDEANGGDSGDDPVPACAHSEKSLRTVPKSYDQLSRELCRVDQAIPMKTKGIIFFHCLVPALSNR